MSLESIDFQSLITQTVQQFMQEWQEAGMSEEIIQQDASNCHNMGMIAVQQIQQEGVIQIPNTDQTLPIDEQSAINIVTWFLWGLNFAIQKGNELKLPSNEKWQLVQQTAMHVFDQAKQTVIATMGQENTPDVQISDEQIQQWLSQTAGEAMMFYLNEFEKQNGPITPTEQDQLLEQAQDVEETPEEQSAQEPSEQPQPAAQQQPQKQPQPAQQQPQQPAAATDAHHKYAAIGLFLNTMSAKRQATILKSFQPEQQTIIQQFQDPEQVAQHLDLAKVTQYLKGLKDQMRLRAKAGGINSQHAATLSAVLSTLNEDRVARLFQHERPKVRGYIHQFMDQARNYGEPIQLPPGVEESLLVYLHRNFPEEIAG